jgi:hypothetical protein
MTDGGGRSQTGPSGVCTVLRLSAIEYQLTLIYMGPDRVKRDSIYRCKCELKRGRTPESGHTRLPPAEVIPNVVRQHEPDDDALKAAHPYGEGAPPGDNTNPPGDLAYRLTITDNHAVPGGTDLQVLLGRQGDAWSKLNHYQKQGWMNDVVPAVPFRVIVRKRVGGTRVDLDTAVRVLIEVKDPVEETELHPPQGRPPRKTKRRQFLERFFGKYNHARVYPTRGGDNGLDLFGGLRYPSSAHPGVQGTEAIRAAPYVAPPHIDRSPGKSAEVPIEQFTPASPSQQAPHKIVLDVTKVKETIGDEAVDVGIADFALTPWSPNHPPPAAVPASGDNYRFLLTLIDDQNQDVRARQEKNKDVWMTDHGRQNLPLPRAYVTGRVVVWRQQHRARRDQLATPARDLPTQSDRDCRPGRARRARTARLGADPPGAIPGTGLRPRIPRQEAHEERLRQVAVSHTRP